MLVLLGNWCGQDELGKLSPEDEKPVINRSPDDDPNLFQRVLKSEQKKIAKQTTDILSDGYYVFEDADKKLVTVSIEEEQRAAVLGTHQFSAIEMEMLLHKHGYSKVPPTPPQSSDSTAEIGGPNSLLRSMLPRSSPPPTKPPSSAVVHFCCTAKIEKVTGLSFYYTREKTEMNLKLYRNSVEVTVLHVTVLIR